jgi:hypothetical protein
LEIVQDFKIDENTVLIAVKPTSANFTNPVQNGQRIISPKMSNMWKTFSESAVHSSEIIKGS